MNYCRDLAIKGGKAMSSILGTRLLDDTPNFELTCAMVKRTTPFAYDIFAFQKSADVVYCSRLMCFFLFLSRRTNLARNSSSFILNYKKGCFPLTAMHHRTFMADNGGFERVLKFGSRYDITSGTHDFC